MNKFSKRSRSRSPPFNVWFIWTLISLVCFIGCMTVINNSVVSKQEEIGFFNDEKIKLIVLILSDAKDESFTRRQVIRNSWCSRNLSQSIGVLCRFVLSETTYNQNENQIEKEMNEFKDILRVNTNGNQDKWEVLPMKVLEGIKWASNFNVPVLKTDHDCWVNIKGIVFESMKFIRNSHYYYYHSKNSNKNNNNNNKFLIGNIIWNSMPKQTQSDKYYDYLWKDHSKHYYSYPSGPGYLISPSLVKSISQWHQNYNTSNNKLPSVLEDVTIGVAMNEIGNVKLIDNPLKFVTKRIPFCIHGMLLKHCALHLRDISDYSINLQQRGDPCRGSFVPDIL